MRPTTKLALLVLSVCGVALRIVMFTKVYHYFVDDAYIFIRYAENLAMGNGLVFNPGERVLGYTSALYALLVSLLKIVLPNVPIEFVLAGLNLVLLACYGYCVFRLIEPGSSIYWFSLVALLFSHPVVEASTNGMETMLFVTLVVAALWALDNTRYGWALFAASAAFLTRPEGAFLFAAALFYCWKCMKGRSRLTSLAVSAAMIAAVFGFLYVYYGTFIPHSMLAKSSQVTSVRWGGYETSLPTKALLLAFGLSDTAFLRLPSTLRIVVSAAFVVALLLFLYGLVRSVRTKRSVLVAAVLYLCLVVFYTVGNPVRIFSWYTYPTAIVFLFVMLHGLEGLALARPLVRFNVALQIVGSLFCVVSMSVIVAVRSGEVNAVKDLDLLGHSICTDYPHTRSIMLGDIGIVGHVTQRKIVDLAGLVSPVVLKNQEDGSAPSLGEVIERTDPDVICLNSDPMREAFVNEGHLLYRSFGSDSAKNAFSAKYVSVDLGCRTYSRIFVRRGL